MVVQDPWITANDYLASSHDPKISTSKSFFYFVTFGESGSTYAHIIDSVFRQKLDKSAVLLSFFFNFFRTLFCVLYSAILLNCQI